MAVGLAAGSLFSGDNDVGLFADGGLGGWVRARPRGPFAAQLDVGYYFGRTSRPLLIEARQQVPVAASMMWFVAPRSIVTPYALAGGNYTYRVTQDQTFGVEPSDRSSLFGLHAGGGVEFALGRSAVLDLEGRYVGFLGRDPGDPPGGFTLTVGIGTHF